MWKLTEPINRWIRYGRAYIEAYSDVSREPESLGTAGERLAADYLKKAGYKILLHGHRQKLGEIDLIVVDGNCLVFVEVKTWRSDADLDPSAAVDGSKQDKITRTALAFLKRRKLLHQPSRFDVISIVWDGNPAVKPKLRHFKSAFEASGRGQFFR